jgi:hypothetical protein
MAMRTFLVIDCNNMLSSIYVSWRDGNLGEFSCLETRLTSGDVWLILPVVGLGTTQHRHGILATCFSREIGSTPQKCEWLQSIRTGLSSIDARIECHKPGIYAPRRVSDTHLIMDSICKCKRFTNPEVRRSETD